MKNAKQYEKKVKKLFSGSLPKRPRPPEDPDVLTVLLRGVLEAETTPDVADKALQAIDEEFVDYNELRVAPYRDIVECVGKDFPDAWEKSQVIYKCLNHLFADAHSRRTEDEQAPPAPDSDTVDMSFLDDMGKRDLRRYLDEAGLTPFASAYVVLHHFQGHAIPVDQALVDCLQMEELVHPDSDVADVQGFLERIVSQKDDIACHQFLRSFVDDHAKPLAELRKARKKQEKQERDKKEAAEQARAAKEKQAQEQQAAQEKQAAEKKAAKSNKTSSAKGKTASKKAASASSRSAAQGTKKAAKKKTKTSSTAKTGKKKSSSDSDKKASSGKKATAPKRAKTSKKTKRASRGGGRKKTGK
jgi:chemotaxis protein histidine kinase CheA